VALGAIELTGAEGVEEIDHVSDIQALLLGGEEGDYVAHSQARGGEAVERLGLIIGYDLHGELENETQKLHYLSYIYHQHI